MRNHHHYHIIIIIFSWSYPRPVFREQLTGKVKLADFGFACAFTTEYMDDGTFKSVPVDMISREPISMEVCFSCCVCLFCGICSSRTHLLFVLLC